MTFYQNLKKRRMKNGLFWSWVKTSASAAFLYVEGTGRQSYDIALSLAASVQKWERKWVVWLVFTAGDFGV